MGTTGQVVSRCMPSHARHLPVIGNLAILTSLVIALLTLGGTVDYGRQLFFSALLAFIGVMLRFEAALRDLRARSDK